MMRLVPLIVGLIHRGFRWLFQGVRWNRRIRRLPSIRE